MDRQKKFMACLAAGLSFIDFDGWNVTWSGHRMDRQFDTLEAAVDWAFRHINKK